MFETPFPHPQQLSDPFGDFYTESEQHKLRVIVDKAPGDLDWSDFRTVFQYGMPAGDFRECAFYLPWAFAHLHDLRDDHLEYLSDMIRWTSLHAEELANANRTSDRVREALQSCLERWTAAFEVFHFDRPACQEKGWGLQYQDFVSNSNVVCTLIDELCREKAFADVAVTFTESLASTRGAAIRSAWYLELVREFNFGSHHGARKKYRSVLTALRDEARWKHHAAVVLETLVPTCPSPTYWNDTLFFI